MHMRSIRRMRRNSDPKSRVYMNGGVVIKQSANQKYTTDAVSEAVTKMICEKAGVPCQVFANHADTWRKHARRNSGTLLSR